MKYRRWASNLLSISSALSLMRGGAHAAEVPRMAVLGDSLATGAATHPALTFDAKDLWRVFSGETPLKVEGEAPTRLWPSKREFLGGPEWVFRHVLQSLSRAYLDTEQYSWGYQLAVSLGIEPSRLILAGEDGARTALIPRHVDRVLDAFDGQLPERIFLLYTGNDLCGQSMELVTSKEDFRRHLHDGLRYIAQNGKPASGGTTVYVLSYLSVLQLLHADAILQKKVKAFGADLTCKELRAQGYRPKDQAYDPGLPPEAWYFSLFMPPNPAAFCPTLFGRAGRPGKSEDETIGQLANRIRDFRKIQADVTELASKETLARGVAVTFKLVQATADLLFAEGDIAGDCFHLSRDGHAKIAAAVRAGL